MKYIDRVLKIILALFLAIIIFAILFDYNKVVYDYKSIVVIIGVVIFIPCMILFYMKVIPKLVTIRCLPTILLSLFTFLCVLFGLLLKVQPGWDMGNIYKHAIAYATNTEVENIVYLYTFPNNVGITMVYTVLFKICTLIGLNDYLTIATLFNSLIVASTGIILYLTAKKLFDDNKALLTVFITLITTPFYLYCAIYYSDTLAMFFLILLTYVYILSKEKTNLRIKIVLYCLLGLFLALGIKVKIVVAFLAIAFVLYKIIKGFNKKEDIYLILTIITSLLIYALLSIITNCFIINDKDMLYNNKLPYEHWIGMGLIGDGRWSYNMYQLNYSLDNYDEKKMASNEFIKERLDNLNLISFNKHIYDKLKYAWTDGSYYAPEKLRRDPVNHNIIQDFILENGRYEKYYKYFPQVLHAGMLIFIFVGVIGSLFSKNMDINTCLYIFMLGLIVFFLLWENRSRYVFPGLPLFIIMELYGIDMFSKIKIYKKDRFFKIDLI